MHKAYHDEIFESKMKIVFYIQFKRDNPPCWSSEREIYSIMVAIEHDGDLEDPRTTPKLKVYLNRSYEGSHWHYHGYLVIPNYRMKCFYKGGKRFPAVNNEEVFKQFEKRMKGIC